MAATKLSALKCRPTKEINVGGQLAGRNQCRQQATDLQFEMKKIRLPEDIYSQKYRPCLITICTKNRMNVFKNGQFVNVCMDLLNRLSENEDIKLFAYCFMPDHVHLIISVQGDKSVVDFVRKFKSISVIKSLQYGFEGRIYQNRFYDHFIRKEDGLNEAIMYVLNNPVRKGLVDDWEDFPYSGLCM